MLWVSIDVVALASKALWGFAFIISKSWMAIDMIGNAAIHHQKLIQWSWHSQEWQCHKKQACHPVRNLIIRPTLCGIATVRLGRHLSRQLLMGLSMRMSHQISCVSPTNFGGTTILHLFAVPSIGPLLPKKAEQKAKAKEEHRAGKASEKMHGTTAKNG